MSWSRPKHPRVANDPTPSANTISPGIHEMHQMAQEQQARHEKELVTSFQDQLLTSLGRIESYLDRIASNTGAL